MLVPRHTMQADLSGHLVVHRVVSQNASILETAGRRLAKEEKEEKEEEEEEEEERE